MYVRMYICTYVFMYVCTYICIYVRSYLCILVCMYICVCVCMYVFIHIYGLLLSPLFYNSNTTSLLPNKYYLMTILFTFIHTIG